MNQFSAHTITHASMTHRAFCMCVIVYAIVSRAPARHIHSQRLTTAEIAVNNPLMTFIVFVSFSYCGISHTVMLTVNVRIKLGTYL